MEGAPGSVGKGGDWMFWAFAAMEGCGCGAGAGGGGVGAGAAARTEGVARAGQLVMLGLRDDAALQKNVGELLVGGFGRAGVFDAGYIGRAEDALGFE